MPAIVLALVSGLGFGTSAIFARAGMQGIKQGIQVEINDSKKGKIYNKKNDQTYRSYRKILEKSS